MTQYRLYVGNDDDSVTLLLNHGSASSLSIIIDGQEFSFPSTNLCLAIMQARKGVVELIRGLPQAVEQKMATLVLQPEPAAAGDTLTMEMAPIEPPVVPELKFATTGDEEEHKAWQRAYTRAQWASWGTLILPMCDARLKMLTTEAELALAQAARESAQERLNQIESVTSRLHSAIQDLLQKMKGKKDLEPLYIAAQDAMRQLNLATSATSHMLDLAAKVTSKRTEMVEKDKAIEEAINTIDAICAELYKLMPELDPLPTK